MVATLTPLKELEEVDECSEKLTIITSFDFPDGRVLKVHLCGRQVSMNRACTIFTWETAVGGATTFDTVIEKGMGLGFRQVAARHPGAVLLPDTIKVGIHRGSRSGAKLVPLVERAWNEAFALPIPLVEDIARRRKQQKADQRASVEKTRLLLATGKAGVKAFNRRTLEERSSTDLRKASMTGFALNGVNFSGVLLDSADLSDATLSGAKFWQGDKVARMAKAIFVGADLTDANIAHCRCADADFSRADLKRVHAYNTNFSRARFVGADLRESYFAYTNLCGVDFTDARLDGINLYHARFDDATKWPRDFDPPAELVWKGDAVDPRLTLLPCEKSNAQPKDFASFLDRLQAVADKAKLDKALGMLKADRFRLFARVEADYLVGVVKSQSDASLVYSCRLDAEGSYGCCTQNLNVCGGLRGSPCKHLLVLIVGLAQAGEIDPGTAHDWVTASRARKPALDKDAMTETLLRFKGAEAGELDWRPTETIPEDFYAM